MFTKNSKGERIKLFMSESYNYVFNETNGHFMRWGKTRDDDPEFSRFGPEILDIEISTICPKACSFCYKTNTGKGQYMTFDTFKKLFHKLPITVTQIAFGIGSIEGNPDLFKIMQYCRDNELKRKIIPNITINGDNLTDEYADKLSEVCGAIAVSMYDYEKCYSAVKKLSDRGMKQVNIHMLLSEETLDTCNHVVQDAKDGKIGGLNAIVFLWLKPKGKRNTYHQVQDFKEYKKLVDKAFKYDVNIGFDSCSAPMFLKAIKERKDYKQMEQLVEPCESTLFSAYINVEGRAFPCSFTEDTDDYTGIDVVNCGDFINDIWYGKETMKFRARVIGNIDENECRNCPAYTLGCNKEV